MAATTTNYGMTKPEINDYYDVEGQNTNMDILDAALAEKLESDSEASNLTETFTEASSRVNILTGETHATIFGKIKKWFSSLGTAAFTDSSAYDASGTASTEVSTHNSSGTAHSTLFNAKLGTSGNGSSVTAAFTAAASRTAIATGESHATIFGKILKWLNDLGTAAFTDSSAYDASGTASTEVSTHNSSGTAHSTLFSAKLGTSGNGSSVTAAFTAAASRTAIATGESLATIFGKILKWLNDLGTAAFLTAGAASGNVPVNGAALGVTANVPVVTNASGNLIPHASGALGSAAFSATSAFDASGAAAALANRSTAANVANASYTTLMFRGESLNAAETTPAVNGAIAWTYE